MQPINRIILFLLLAGGGIYYWMRTESQAEYDRQVGALASALDHRFLSAATPASQADAMFLRALVIYSDYRTLVARGRVHTGEETYLRDSLTAAGYTSDSEIILIIRSLRENLGQLESMQVISQNDSVPSLLDGHPPIIRAGSFKGDTLVLGRRVSPALALPVINHPANLALIPSNAAALVWPLNFSDHTLATIEEFKACNIIDARLAFDLAKRADQVRNLSH